MKELIGVLIATALLIGATAIFVRAGDRATLVPPPEAVAENFVRESVAKQWSRAAELTSSRDEQLPKELQQRIEARVGEPTRIEAEIVSETADQALVTVRLSSRQGSEAVTFALAFEGEWRVGE